MRKKINCKKKRKKYEFSIFKFYDISKKFKEFFDKFYLCSFFLIRFYKNE